MKTRYSFGFIALVILFASCDKKTYTQEEEPYPAEPVFTLSFILVDSVGNNLLPNPLPANPVFDIEEFRASTDRNDSIGWVARNYNDFGNVFKMRESFEDITSDPSFLPDSTFVFYPCFGSDCDTVIIKKTDFFFSDVDSVRVTGCSADQIIWNTDTFINYYCNQLEIKKSF